jgi:hypothetical protein
LTTTSINLFKKFCHTGKHVVDKTKLEHALQKFIDKLQARCLCQYISCTRLVSAKLTYYVANVCKKRCNFCRYEKIFILYDYLKELPYGDIKYLIGFDRMIQDDRLINNLTEHHIKLLSLNNMCDIILAKPDMKFNDVFVDKIITTLKSKPITSRSKHLSLFQQLVSNSNFLEQCAYKISNVLCELLNSKMIDDISCLQISNAGYQYLIESCIMEGDNPEQVIQLANLCDTIFLPHHVFQSFYNKYAISVQYDSYVCKIICTKMVNIIEFISYATTKLRSSKTTLYIDPLHIQSSFSTICETALSELIKPNGTFIKYLTPIGHVGYDAGGLTKDMYSILFKLMKDNFDKIDGYYIPTDRHDIAEPLWALFGIMLCKAVYREYISPTFLLHPLICMDMQSTLSPDNKSYSVERLDQIFNYMRSFNLEFFVNLEKVWIMTDDEYKAFIVLQGESISEKHKYISKILKDKYYNKNCYNFVTSFHISWLGYPLSRYATPDKLFKFICGNLIYPIIGNDSNTMETNLSIDNETTTSQTFVDRFYFTFLEVLEHLNKTDLPTLQKFMLFWLGTTTIDNFEKTPPTIRICSHDTFNCFKSSTCFNRLYVYHKDVKKHDLFKHILILINATLHNQDLSEQAGFRMQYE